MNGIADAQRVFRTRFDNIMTRFPRPGSWYRFTAADWQFICDALALSRRNKEGLVSLLDDPEAVRMILDHPKLFHAILVSRTAGLLSPDLFFFVVVRHTLMRIGVEDLEVADYVAVVCSEFGCRTAGQDPDPSHVQSLYSVDYIAAIEEAGPQDRFFLHMQCANQFLVLTSLFPDFLHRRAERRGAPDVDFYEGVVMNHLDAASRHGLACEFALDAVLAQLAESFPPVRRAMNHTVREYLSLGQ